MIERRPGKTRMDVMSDAVTLIAEKFGHTDWLRGWNLRRDGRTLDETVQQAANGIADPAGLRQGWLDADQKLAEFATEQNPAKLTSPTM